MLLPRTAHTALAACALALSGVRAALLEPAGNQVLFGAWVDTEFRDNPLKYNQRIGHNASVFQIAQNIPRPAYNYITGAGGPAPEYLIEQSQTDAHVFLTVYPTTFSISQTDYNLLAVQINNYTSAYNRSVFLRFAPEMQGQWFPYGFQPTAFRTMWINMYNTMKQLAPNCVIVWAPNTGQSYPYGQSTTNAADLRLLDTNGDGDVTTADDAFAPYYPGDDYVDWIGLSVYYKGPNGQNLNTPQGPGFCGQALNDVNPNTGLAAGPSNFYQTYCAGKPTKACMYAESGAAYHVDVPGGSTQLAMQRAWWQGCTLNETFYNTFPRLKLFMQFEYLKTETDGGISDLRDYRVTNATDVLAAFNADLAPVATRFAWAGVRQAPESIPSTGRPADLPGGVASSTSTVGLVFQTMRILDIGPPSLFGNTSDAVRALQLSLALACGVGAIGVASVFMSVRRMGASARGIAQ